MGFPESLGFKNKLKKVAEKFVKSGFEVDFEGEIFGVGEEKFGEKEVLSKR